MGKRFTDENGKTYVEKKPFYKRVWFWVLAVILIIIIGSSLNNKGVTKEADNGGKKISSSSTSASSEKENKKSSFYKVGDTVKVGDVEYTLTSVSLTDERNSMSDSQPANVVKVSYTEKNTGKDDIPIGMDIEVYGPDNKKAETYPNDNTMGSVAPGKSMDCTAHFGLNSKGEIEIHFSPLVSLKKAAIFKANI
ncbi:DUF5067 domain-containing protein [Enterococcus faecalis]